MKLPKARFYFLNKVSVCLYTHLPYTEKDARVTIKMLQDLHSVRYLTLNWDINVQCLSSFLDLLSHNTSPFSNLICLTIDPSVMKVQYKVTMPIGTRNFFLDNSPNAILKFPKEPPTKEARVKKKAKLAADALIHMEEMVTLLEKGIMIIVEQREKSKAALENFMNISSKEGIIRSLLDKLPKGERPDIEALYARQIEVAKAQRGFLLPQILNSEQLSVFEKLLSDNKSASQSRMPSSSSTSISTPSTSSKNPMS